MITFQQPQLLAALHARRLLCQPLPQALQRAMQQAQAASSENWQVELGDNLLFDVAGLAAICQAIQGYSGPAQQLHFRLKLSAPALRDYYSHSIFLQDEQVLLPVRAWRGEQADRQDTLTLVLPETLTDIRFPLALTPPDQSHTPLALLLPYACAHDLLFANQIAVIANIARQVRRAPLSWLRALLARRGGTLRQQIALHWKQVAADAQIHPTAVIEGSVIGPGCRIGAHCVVRYSVLGAQVHLHDGAKVEYSAVDDGTWLMHDLVLYRCLVESQVFLIHGPYQFSYFQQQSAAFATIMMDYRPDDRPIQINTPHGVRAYRGRFLGALLEEDSKVLGGSLIAPGITIPQGRHVGVKAENIIRGKDLLPRADEGVA